MTANANANVAVIGGGYGGTAVAKALDPVADVVLIEPRDSFVHNVAALRSLVDPEWVDRIFLPYARLLERGRVVQDRAARVDGEGVTLGSGERITPDYVVLATGSSYPFPAKIDHRAGADGKAAVRAAHGSLAGAARVLLLGAGPAGLELAGEISAAWPEKTVTLVDPADDILGGGFPDEFRAELRGQLDGLGVELVLGTSLREEPPSGVGEAKTFTAVTRSGREIEADIWFRCYGATPNSGYLAGDLASARLASGLVEVTGDLRLPGQERVFALGDLTALPEAKMAKAAGEHAGLIAASIRTLLEGGTELARYEPAPPGISLPLGPTGGASYAVGMGMLGAERTSQIKGADLRMEDQAKLLGLG